MAAIDQDRILATITGLAEATRVSNFWISGDGRIGEQDAAKLLGWSPDSLRNARTEKAGPRSYRLGGGGHRVTYRLMDLAKWIESHCEEEQPARR